MTAQQQLAELMSMKLGDRGAFWCDSAACFLRDHGPAIAELIEAARKLVDGVPEHEPQRPETSNHDDTRDRASDWESWYTANTLRTAIRKLTQDA